MVWSLSLDEEAVSSAFCFATSSAFWFFPSISETRCTYCSEASSRALEPGSQSTLIEHITDLFLYFFLHGSTITPHFLRMLLANDKITTMTTRPSCFLRSCSCGFGWHDFRSVSFGNEQSAFISIAFFPSHFFFIFLLSPLGRRQLNGCLVGVRGPRFVSGANGRKTGLASRQHWYFGSKRYVESAVCSSVGTGRDRKSVV